MEKKAEKRAVHGVSAATKDPINDSKPKKKVVSLEKGGRKEKTLEGGKRNINGSSAGTGKRPHGRMRPKRWELGGGEGGDTGRKRGLQLEGGLRWFCHKRKTLEDLCRVKNRGLTTSEKRTEVKGGKKRNLRREGRQREIKESGRCRRLKKKNIRS